MAMGIGRVMGAARRSLDIMGNSAARAVVSDAARGSIATEARAGRGWMARHPKTMYGVGGAAVLSAAYGRRSSGRSGIVRGSTGGYA